MTNYKPYIYRMLDSIFSGRFQELHEAEILKETDKAYLIKYINQLEWVPKQFVKIKNDKISVENWIVKKKFV